MSTDTLDRPTTPPDEQPDRDAVVAHELGHLIVAWHHHAPVHSISVVPEVVDGRTSLGWVDADLSCLSPREQAQVVLAGPLNGFLRGHDVGPGSIDDFLRVAALGYHHQDRGLAAETKGVLDLHHEVMHELDYYLSEHGDARAEFDAEFLWHWREGVQDVALAALVLPGEMAQGYRDCRTVIVETLVSSHADGELVLAELRRHWRLTAANDWRGQRRLKEKAALVKDAMERLPVGRRKARAT